jgi:hypothetical protein
MLQKKEWMPWFHSTKKSVKIHQLWCEFHRNLTLSDLIPSSIVDEITDHWDKVWRNLYNPIYRINKL